MKRQTALISFAVTGALIAWAVSRFMRERFDAVALLVAAGCFYYLGARFYSLFIASRVVSLDDANVTPAHRLRDNRDFMPFRRWTLFVVNALKGSPWGTFTIAASIPIAFLVGWYMTRLRPGHEAQGTVIGVALLIGATAAGAWIAETPALASIFTRTDRQLAVAIV